MQVESRSASSAQTQALHALLYRPPRSRVCNAEVLGENVWMLVHTLTDRSPVHTDVINTAKMWWHLPVFLRPLTDRLLASAENAPCIQHYTRLV
eukprot:1158453-Pelagomonas_calceolata.AAC.4